jgi:hypothetical protein
MIDVSALLQDMHTAAKKQYLFEMASKGYMIWTCDRVLPEETIQSIQNAIDRRKLYGALPTDTKATYNCADDWKKYRNEWKKILMDGSRV